MVFSTANTIEQTTCKPGVVALSQSARKLVPVTSSLLWRHLDSNQEFEE